MEKEWYQEERQRYVRRNQFIFKVTRCQNVNRIKVATDFVKGAQIFQKRANTIKILGTRLVICSQFQTDDSQVLDVTVNISACEICSPLD